MEITKVLNSMKQDQAPKVATSKAPQVASLQAQSSSSSSSSSAADLSSKYTYAIGNDGIKYVLQLRIDVVSLGSVSELA